MSGGEGDDVVKGNKGDDVVSGDRGDDVVKGGKGNDFVSGGKGSDLVRGNIGNDHLRGADASSTRGSGEVDQLSGGSGADVFYLGDKTGAYYLDLDSGIVGYAYISDFDLKDKLAFHRTKGIRIIRDQKLDGIDGYGSAIYQDQDLVAFVQGDTAAINSIDLDDQDRVVRQSFPAVSSR